MHDARANLGIDAHARTGLTARFFDLSIDLLCCLGFDGYFRLLSPSWARTLGFSPEEMRSRRFIEFVHPDDRQRTLDQNREVRDGGQARMFENRYLCRDGSFRWLLWNANPDPAEGVIFAIARDITERKAAEMQREALVADLRMALAEVRTLRALLPICAYCKRIRDEQEEWHTVEAYLSRHAATQFSHGICPRCYDRLLASELGDGPENG